MLGFSRRPTLLVRGSLAVFGALAVASCSDAPSLVLPESRVPAQALVTLTTSQDFVRSGERVTVTVRATRPDVGLPTDLLGGLQGRLVWDPERFALEGQLSRDLTLVSTGIDAARPGRMRLLAVNPTGVPRLSASFTFRARSDSPMTAGFRFDPGIVAGPDGTVLEVDRALPVTPSSSDEPSVDPSGARVLSTADWLEYLTPWSPDGAVSGPGPLRVPGAGTVYGDVNLDLEVNVLDVLLVANGSVGNQEIIVGTNDPPVDLVVAGNVRPANLPGFGESSDSCAPGVDACGAEGRTLNVLDVLAIARASVGLSEDIVGELIPRAVAADTVFLLPGSITDARTLSADSVYVLTGTVTVEGGGSLAAPPGARILGSAGSALVVARDGRAELRGSFLDPVVLSCHSGAPQRGCWRGLTVLGNAPVNRGTPGSSGCPEVLDDPRDGPFGGCDPADDRGVFTHIRVEFASRGLELLGVGNGTLVDRVQVHASETGGVTVAGGSVDLRHLLVTATGGSALGWRDGWSGRAQNLLLQLDPTGGSPGILGRNALGDPAALPFSRPTLFNVSVVGVALGSTTGAAVELRDGTGAEIHNLLALTTPTGLDIDGAESCGRIPGELVVAGSVFAGVPNLGDPDVDGAPCAGSPATEADFLQDAAAGNLQIVNSAEVSGLLVGALDAFIPDFRSTVSGTASGLVGDAPPADGFFDAAATYVGGVPGATVGAPALPWYSGWTRGGIESTADFGRVQGSVVFDDGHPVVGAVVYADLGDLTALTQPTGGYLLELVRPGTAALGVANLPAGCTAPDAGVFVTAGSTAQILPIEVTCP